MLRDGAVTKEKNTHAQISWISSTLIMTPNCKSGQILNVKVLYFN